MPELSHRAAGLRPFAEWPGGLSFGEGRGTVWFLSPAILCVETRVARVDLSYAEEYVDAIRTVRDAERSAIARFGGLRIYQDLRSLHVIERGARRFLVEAAHADFGRWELVYNKIELAPQNPIVRAAIRLVGQVTSQMGLPAYDLTVDLARELARDGIRAPSASPENEARYAGYARARRPT